MFGYFNNVCAKHYALKRSIQLIPFIEMNVTYPVFSRGFMRFKLNCPFKISCLSSYLGPKISISYFYEPLSMGISYLFKHVDVR